MNNKEFNWRMQGMIYALNIAKEKGVEELEKDIRKRNILKAPLKFTSTQIDDFFNELSANLHVNMLTCALLTLHEEFGFGEERLKRYKRYFDKLTMDAMSLDYLGQHYVTLADFAVDLNKRFRFDLDINRICACVDGNDERREDFAKVDIKRVLSELESNGFQDASAFLENKIM